MSSLWCGKLNDAINWNVIDVGLVCRYESLIIEYLESFKMVSFITPFGSQKNILLGIGKKKPGAPAFLLYKSLFPAILIMYTDSCPS